MKLLTTKSNLFLTLSILCTTANQACFASRGDLIAHTVPQQTTVRTYRVVGWQNELTAANPNLGNYYWEPLTKRIINTTRTTSKGATAAPAIVPGNSAHYQKPIHAALPVNSNVQLQTNANLTSPRSEDAVLGARMSMQPVLTYQNTRRSRCSDQTAVASYTTKESVFGVVKSNSTR